MIQKKSQIITGYLEENFSRSTPRMKKQLFNVLNRLPEITFIEVFESAYNWKLDPIRKNQYIVKY